MSSEAGALDPLRRFSNRVEKYARFRPSYPPELLRFLETECELSPHTQIADIGCGTGLLARLFLDYGCDVIGVEPNSEMRESARMTLAGCERFQLVEGRAEQTTLPAHSVDLVTAGQAFHWFKPAQARAEFFRITRPPHWAAIVWNSRRTAGDEFHGSLDALLHQHGTDYSDVAALRFKPDDFFRHSNWLTATFQNQQVFDLVGLRGRIESMSFAPQPGTAAYESLMIGVEDLFRRTAEDNRITLRYDTMLYAGRISPESIRQ